MKKLMLIVLVLALLTMGAVAQAHLRGVRGVTLTSTGSGSGPHVSEYQQHFGFTFTVQNASFTERRLIVCTIAGEATQSTEPGQPSTRVLDPYKLDTILRPRQSLETEGTLTLSFPPPIVVWTLGEIRVTHCHASKH